MSSAQERLRRLLGDLEGRIDPERLSRIRTRHRAALAFQPLDIPVLICYTPYAGADFQPYQYAEAFNDPAKMMVNELLVGFTSVYHALDLPDDAPCCIRPNFGTGIIASMFGAEISVVGDSMPWARPAGGIEALRAIVESPLPDVGAGLGTRVIEQYEFYRSVLADYPACRDAIEITLPDLQSPFDTAELLWGSEILLAVNTQPDLVAALLDRVADQMLTFYSAIDGLVRDSLRTDAQYQHAVPIRGKMLLRNDTPILVGPKLYEDLIRPFDARLARELEGIAIHFCGNGQHQIAGMLAIPGMQCFDFGQSEMMDVDAIYRETAPQRVVLARISPPREELTAKRMRQRFPEGGVVLTYQAESPEDARKTWERYVSQM